MMEGGSLFNTGFFGSSFYWWMGQIADDSTWRDNELPNKFSDRYSPPGWGKRYKVRIIGVHDKEEETIPSDQLPWANIMYPVTAGGGQAGSHQSANLRQGMFVFGFYMDGQDMQVPVIMGVLGNNVKTPLKTKIGNDDSNFSGTSGVAQGQQDKEGTAKEPIPDVEQSVTKPKSEDTKKEESSISKNIFDKLGLPTDRQPNKNELFDLSAAKEEVERIKLDPKLVKKYFGVDVANDITESQINNFVKNTVQVSRKRRVAESNKSNSPTEPGATIESVDALQLQTAEDLKKEDNFQEKIVLANPNDSVNSAIKAMQTISENLAKKTEKHLASFSDYADAVSGAPEFDQLTKFKKDSACAMSKYMKVILDKMMEYTNKTVNEELTAAVGEMPNSLRYQMGDMAAIANEKLLEKYNGITDNICGLMEGILDKSINLKALSDRAKENATKVGITTEQTVIDPENGKQVSQLTFVEEDLSHPNVPICSAESLIGQALFNLQDDISETNNEILKGTSNYFKDIKSELDRFDNDLTERSDIDTSRGGVLEITDEEVLDEVRGGTLYKTAKRVGTLFRSSTNPSRNPAGPVGFTTAETTGQGLTVDITVSTGGLAGKNNAGGATDFEFTNQGTGYPATGQPGTNALNCNGGSGQDMKVNIVTSGGSVTNMFVHTTGTGYKKGEEMTIQAGGFNAKFTLTEVEGKIDDGGIKVNQRGTSYVTGDLYTVLDGSDDATFLILEVSNPGDGVAKNNSPRQKLSGLNFDIGNLVGNMTAALNFENITANVFPFELPPNPAVSDFYTLANGGEGLPDFQLPNFSELPAQIEKATSTAPKDIVPFAEPTIRKTVDLARRTISTTTLDSTSTTTSQTSTSSDGGTTGATTSTTTTTETSDATSSTPTGGSTGGGGGGGY